NWRSCCRHSRRCLHAMPKPASGSLGSPAKSDGERRSPLSTAPAFGLGFPAGFDFLPRGGPAELSVVACGGRLSPIANVRPSRCAVGAGGEATGKGDFPMPMTGTVKFFNGERGYRSEER